MVPWSDKADRAGVIPRSEIRNPKSEIPSLHLKLRMHDRDDVFVKGRRVIVAFP